MSLVQIVPPVAPAESCDLQGNRGGSGDGGNRTRETVPPSETPHMQVESCGQTSGAAPRERPAPGTEGVSPMHADPIPVPLRDRTGATIAYAVLDATDAHLAEHRWYLDSDPARPLGKQYARRNERQGDRVVPIYLHREVLGLAPGDPRQGDHINGLTLDCRRANLRIATIAQQAQNRRKRTGTSSRFRGVTWDKSRQKWMAAAMLDGKRKTLGRFDSEEEAAAVAAEFRRTHMPYSQEAA